MRLTPLLLLAALAAVPVRGADPEGQVRFADALFARGMYQLALTEYEAASAAGGLTNGAAVLYRRAESHRALGQESQARALYEQLTATPVSGPYAVRAALRLAERAISAGAWDDAARALDAVREEEVPNDLRSGWRYYRAYAGLRKGTSKEPVRLLRALLKDDPAASLAPHARLELAEALAADPARADERERLLAEASSGDPAAPVTGEALVRLAAVRYQRGAFDGAASDYDRLRVAQPARFEAARTAAGWAYYRAGRFADSLAAAGGEEAEALYLRANALRGLGRADEAASLYDRLLVDHAAAPFVPAARYERAALALEQGDYAAALALAEKVETTPAIAADLLWLKAEALRGLGRSEEARLAFAGLAERHASSARAVPALFQAGRLAQDAAQWDLASAHFRAAAAAATNDVTRGDAWLSSAWCRSKAGQHREAVQDWTALLEQISEHPRRDEAWYGRAQAAVALALPDEARGALESLLKETPSSRLAGEARFQLGALLEAKGLYEPAEYHYRLAARAGNDPALRRRIEFRRVAVLQRQGRQEDAAEALNALLAEPGSALPVPSPLLEWLARWNLEQSRWAEAERAALALAAMEGLPGWRAVGWHAAGRAREAQELLADARVAYANAAAQEADVREVADAALRAGQLALAAGETDAARGLLARAGERAATEDRADIRAQAYVALGDLAVASGQDVEAVRYFLGVALLYDDPVLTPRALRGAAAALERTGRLKERDQTLDELRARYPEAAL